MKITKIKNPSKLLKAGISIVLSTTMMFSLTHCKKKDTTKETTTSITQTDNTTRQADLTEKVSYVIDEYTNPEEENMLDILIIETKKYGDIELYKIGNQFSLRIKSVNNYPKLIETLSNMIQNINISVIESEVAVFEKLYSNLKLPNLSKIVLFSDYGYYNSSIDLSKYKTLDEVELIDAGVAKLPKGISKLIITGLDKENKLPLNAEEEIKSLYSTEGLTLIPGQDKELEEYSEAGKYLEKDLALVISNADLSNAELWAYHDNMEINMENCTLSNTVLDPVSNNLYINCNNCQGQMSLSEYALVRKVFNVETDSNNIILPEGYHFLNRKAQATVNGITITNDAVTLQRKY